MQHRRKGVTSLVSQILLLETLVYSRNSVAGPYAEEESISMVVFNHLYKLC